MFGVNGRTVIRELEAVFIPPLPTHAAAEPLLARQR